MPIIKSAKKRTRTARKATIRNAKTKRSMKSALKSFAKSPSSKTFSLAQSQIDTAAKKNVIHKNKAARQKRQLAARAKAAGVKPAKTAAKSTTSAKKTTAKKPTASKTATKKAPAKKASK